jgi:hypothetical protein
MTLTVDIDGTSITEICQSITWRSALSRPSTGVVRFPSHLFSIQTGIAEMHIYNGATLVFSGPVWNLQTEGGTDSAYTEITAYDHLVYLQKRLCKQGTTPPGNLIKPIDVILDNITAPEILAAYIENSKIIDDAAEGPPKPLPLDVDFVASGGDDMTGVPMNFPMSIDEMRSMLVSTGQLDVVVRPGIGSSTIDLYNGNYGTDRTGSVSYDYGTGNFNSQIATLTEDMDVVVNALWYLLGPRVPGFEGRRWRGSITPTAANAGGDGQAIGGNPGQPWPPTLVEKFMNSRTSYGYFQEVRIYDEEEDEQDIRELYEHLWANEAWIRARARQFVSIRPERGISPNFGIGDLISLSGGPMLNGGGFSGAQRVYEVEWSCDPDGVMECVEIVASADQEDAPGAP